jgi:hypothetical protein
VRPAPSAADGAGLPIEHRRIGAYGNSRRPPVAGLLLSRAFRSESTGGLSLELHCGLIPWQPSKTVSLNAWPSPHHYQAKISRRGASPGGGGRVGKALKSELSSHRVDSSGPTEKNKGTEESAAVFNFSQSTKQIQLFLFHMCSQCLF